MKITIRVYDPCIAVLVLFVLLTENGMYLIDTAKLNISGALNYNDMWAYTLFLYEVYYLLKIKMPKSYNFKFGVWGLIASAIIASFQCSYIVGQPFMMGIRPQRFFIISLMAYFLVRKQLATKKMTAVNVLDLLLTMGIVEGFLCTLQYFLSGHIMFLHAGSNMRYGSIRMYLDSGLMIYTAIAGWCFYLKKGEKRYLIALAFGLIYEFLISKGRLENVCVIFSLFAAFILLKKNAFRKVMVLITLITAGVLLMNTSYSKVLINTVKSTFSSSDAANEDDDGETGDTMVVRKQGREYYNVQSNKSASNLILGCGYPNTLYEKACEYARTDTFALVDNGIFAYKYIYGLLGMAIVCLLALKALILSFILYLKKGALFPLAYIIFLIPVSYNIIFWWWKPDSTLLLSIYLAVLDHYCHDECDKDEFFV